MRRVVCRHSLLRAFVVAPFVALAFAFIPAAFGQHTFARPGGTPHVNAPRVLMQPILQHRLIRPVRPVFPIFPPRRFAFLGAPLFGRGLGLEFSPAWWRSCGPYGGWTWGYNCYAAPVYIGEENRELPQLYLRDGTVYNVTDYWAVNNQLHFTTIDESGTKWNEQTIDASKLDLQKTADVAKQRGFHFLMRNEPMQQYLQHHPEIGESRPASEQPQAPTPSTQQ
jgi:hypothetical protein